jgi:hypothetical protein
MRTLHDHTASFATVITETNQVFGRFLVPYGSCVAITVPTLFVLAFVSLTYGGASLGYTSIIGAPLYLTCVAITLASRLAPLVIQGTGNTIRTMLRPEALLATLLMSVGFSFCIGILGALLVVIAVVLELSTCLIDPSCLFSSPIQADYGIQQIFFIALPVIAFLIISLFRHYMYLPQQAFMESDDTGVPTFAKQLCYEYPWETRFLFLGHVILWGLEPIGVPFVAKNIGLLWLLGTVFLLFIVIPYSVLFDTIYFYRRDLYPPPTNAKASHEAG